VKRRFRPAVPAPPVPMWGWVLAAFLACSLPAFSDQPVLPAVPPRWYQAVNLSGDCLVESHDPVFNDDIIGVLDRFERQLLPPVPPAPPNLPVPLPASRLLVRVEPQDPAALPRPPFLFLRNPGAPHPDFQVTFFAGPDNPPQVWLRKIVVALLYRKAVAAGADFSSGDDLPPVPLWIAEGAFQSLFENGTDQQLYRELARRAGFLGKTPSIETIFGWKTLSPDPLMNSWQQAFSWQLYLFYRNDPARAAVLEAWFKTLAEAQPAPWPLNTKIEEQWSAFQKNIGDGPDVLYGWDRTADELAAAQVFVLPADAKNQGRLVKWSELPQMRNDPALPALVRSKIAQFEVLEMRANFAWRPVIALYRDALNSLYLPSGDPAAAFAARLADADQAAQRLNSLAQRVGDYLNWFEVTRKTGGSGPDTTSQFEDYFNLSRQFDAWEGDGSAASP